MMGIMYAPVENGFFGCRNIPEPRCGDLSDLLDRRDSDCGAGDVPGFLSLTKAGSIGEIASGKCRPAVCIRRAKDK
jgi:hypothetical protein